MKRHFNYTHNVYFSQVDFLWELQNNAGTDWRTEQMLKQWESLVCQKHFIMFNGNGSRDIPHNGFDLLHLFRAGIYKEVWGKRSLKERSEGRTENMLRTLQRRTKIQLVWAQGLCSYGASKFLIIATRLPDITVYKTLLYITTLKHKYKQETDSRNQWNTLSSRIKRTLTLIEALIWLGFCFFIIISCIFTIHQSL